MYLVNIGFASWNLGFTNLRWSPMTISQKNQQATIDHVLVANSSWQTLLCEWCIRALTTEVQEVS
jgi:hypothetical protein